VTKTRFKGEGEFHAHILMHLLSSNSRKQPSLTPTLGWVCVSPNNDEDDTTTTDDEGSGIPPSPPPPPSFPPPPQDTGDLSDAEACLDSDGHWDYEAGETADHKR
jgi:hypothetical protein